MAIRGSGQDEWWWQTARLAATVIAAATLGAILPVLISRWFGGSLWLGLPFPLFLLAFAVPAGGLAAAFWFTRRQSDLDQRYDVAGD